MAADGNFEPDIDRMLALVRARAGVDFLHYRPATVQRRILNRMLSAGMRDSADYLDFIERTPDEAWRLLERLTIKVSRFCRDRAVFDFLATEVMPGWARRGRPARIWSAGCARGEEAYTLAMMLVRHGIEGTVLATDVDPSAIAIAEAARYPSTALAELSDEERAFCFDPTPGAAGWHTVTDEVRARVRFVRHDLTGGSQIAGNFDLIACRNVMIYFGQAMQRVVQANLVDALAPGGYLCLGESEWPESAVMPQLQAMPRRVRTFRRVS